MEHRIILRGWSKRVDFSEVWKFKAKAVIQTGCAIVGCLFPINSGQDEQIHNSAFDVDGVGTGSALSLSSSMEGSMTAFNKLRSTTPELMWVIEEPLLPGYEDVLTISSQLSKEQIEESEAWEKKTFVNLHDEVESIPESVLPSELLTKKQYTCEVCSKIFTSKGNFNKHQLMHTGERNWECGECHKSFTTNGHLKTHQITHTGERNWKCGECRKSFITNGNLKTHQIIHTGEQKWHCNLCVKSFIRNEHLKAHQTTVHTGERKWACDKCRKSFITNVNLKRHQTVHTGEKPYGCQLCGKCFTCKDSLRKHGKRHADEKSHTV